MIEHFKRQKLLAAAFVAALAITVFFVIQALDTRPDFRGPPDPDQPVAGWMTPMFVVRTWDLPRDVVGEALNLQRDRSARRITIDDLAAQQGRPAAELIDALTAAIEAHEARGGRD